MKAIKPNQGEKMIEVRLRFFTNSIASESNKIIPKHALTQGMAFMQRNESHGIVGRKPRPFNSLLDIGQVIEKVLIAHGVVLIPSSKMKKYVTTKSEARS
jgi:hypothetical protein